MKAISTLYSGFSFRSRLEARWAVFFDTLGVRYEYEKEGFDLGAAGWYLPDFWLPDQYLWIEIKGKTATHEECVKAAALADQSGCPVVILAGQIGGHVGRYEHGNYDPPQTEHTTQVFCGYHLPPDGGYGCSGVAYQIKDDLTPFLRNMFPQEYVPSYDRTRKTTKEIIELDRRYFRNKYGKEHPRWIYGIVSSSDVGWRMRDNQLDLDHTWHLDTVIEAAYAAARSARFEHGETPRTPRGKPR